MKKLVFYFITSIVAGLLIETAFEGSLTKMNALISISGNLLLWVVFLFYRGYNANETKEPYL